MDDWEKLNETPLPEKEDFYSDLNIHSIYQYANSIKNTWKILIKIKNKESLI